MFEISCATEKCANKLKYKLRQVAKAAEKANRICKNCRKERKVKKKERESLNWKRDCPSCSKVINYNTKDSFNRALSEDRICRACSDSNRRSKYYSGKSRLCPSCSKKLKYKNTDSCTFANRENLLCKSCSLKSKGIMPSQECVENALKANLGRVQTEEEKAKRAETNMERFGAKSYLQSNAYRSNMIQSGVIQNIHGKTPMSWAKDNGIPPTAIYKWLSLNPNPTSKEITLFCQKYTTSISSIENRIQNYLNLELWNKSFSSEMRYRPDFKLTDYIALNVDGLYWHSAAINKDKFYHFNMRKEYEKNNLRVFQFRADEVWNKINIIKSMVDNSLGLVNNKIGARKTKIRKVKYDEAFNFLEENHLKGYIKSSCIGLYYNEELISLMSYKVQRKKGFIKIDRFCSKAGFSVMGGFSKLLKYIESLTENLPIHYWVDLRYGTGTFMLDHGFKLEKETLGWEWTDFKNTYNRLRCRANMDKRGLSESEYAAELGWVRIYDAGQRLFIKN